MNGPEASAWSSSEDWCLAPDLLHLNHGAFGAVPKAVREAQQALRDRVEAEPAVWFERHHLPALDHAREELASFLGTRPASLALVPNATVGVNTVLASCPVEPGEEWMCTDHTYHATRNALLRWADARGATVRAVPLPFPIARDGDWEERILAAVGPRTRLALLDHVTSATGAVLDVARLVPELERRGVRVLLDSAHGAGMLDWSLEQTGASWTVGNGHKWLCGAKGSGFLHVRGDLLDQVEPLVTSHGRDAPDGERGRFRWMADWLGTLDYTAMYVLPEALAFVERLRSGGWPAHRAALLRRARSWTLRSQEILGQPSPLPSGMMGAMSVMILPDGHGVLSGPRDPLNLQLRDQHGIVAGVFNWPTWPRRILRLSAQAYVPEDAPERLIEALRELGALSR
ncbi:MAG: aminotransferase class V-fold PLP-dependent enzyme [Candidatus Sericytochromatia bacterium]|nr:aminotransferase class V-fold PLP-dependent enzyme [Candidatus Sericytochromatia bacterium]